MAAIVLVLQSAALGLVQGLTEFIPISSSAHLVIVPWLFGWTDPALGGLTPLQAAKTEIGREKLSALLDYYDRMQDATPPPQVRIDLDRLRRMLGLTPKAN